MTRLRMIGLALIAMFAVVGAAAANASAEAPEFGRCLKVAKGTGKFKGSNCTIEAVGGAYEWTPGPGVSSKFTINWKEGIPTFETVFGTKITCKTATGTGEYTGTKTVGQVLITLKGCETSGGVVTSPGQPEGTIVLKPLMGVLGVEKKGETRQKDTIGLDLFPQETGGLVLEAACAGLPITMRGSLISSPLIKNKMLVPAPVNFIAKSGKQKPERFEGEPRDVLESNTNGGPFEQAGLTLHMTQTNEEAIEVNSVV
jgi:hypothetical protein